MIVYHGSLEEVASPDVYHSRDNVDLGKGFYLTPIKEQADMYSQAGDNRKISLFFRK